MKKTILTIALIASSYAQAGSVSADNINSIEAKYNECVEVAVSTADSNLCSLEANESADAELNRVYGLIKNSLKQSKDEESKVILTRLVNSEKAWITYRDANCQLQGIEMLGGSGEGQIISGCIASQTISRVKELIRLFGVY